MAVACGAVCAETVGTAGHAIFVYNTVWRVPADGEKLPLAKGDAVFENDTIMTGRKGSVQLLMSDGAFLAVRPDTTIRLDVYHYDKNEEEGLGESIITLLKGCFRSITGLIGKENKENYRIRTPVANIGIRGTDHEPLYIPEPADGTEPIGEPGLYDKVYSGETYIENDAGSVTILPNQAGFVPDRNTLPVVGETIPDVYDYYSATSIEASDEAAENSTDASTSPAGDSDLFSGPIAAPTEIITETTPPETTESKTSYTGYFNWPDALSYTGNTGFTADESDLKTDANGNLSGYLLPDVASPDPDRIQGVRLVNPTAGTRGEAGHYSETGIDFGTWQADAIEQIRYDGTRETFPIGNGLVHWIKGGVSPTDYLSQVITGTQTYTFDGGTSPTNQDGIAGVLNSATLAVDFSHQSVDATLALNVNSHDWSASATDIPLVRGEFSAANPLLTVERDGVAGPSVWGSLSGTLAGDGLNGALLGYTLGDIGISETVNGTVAFFGSGQDTTTPYREIGIAGTDFRSPMPSAMALHSVSGATGISSDVAGNLTGFDLLLPEYSMTPSGDAESPVRLDIGSARLADTGTDPDSGVIWGRWAGTIDASDRVTGATLSPAFNPENLHFIAGPESSSPVMLPITGTRTYQFSGGTNPTDNYGTIGTLNSATLSADFSNMTVATGINATVGTTTFDASSIATPIEGGRYFTATHRDSLMITSSGAGAGTTHTGVISGAFYGAHGESAGAAYSFNTTDGGSINTTVSGVAGFK